MTSETSLSARGIRAFQQKNYEEAARLFEESLSYEFDITILRWQASSLFELKQYQRAMEIFKLVFELEPVMLHKWDYANCLYNLNRLSESRALLKEILQEDPGNKNALDTLEQISQKEWEREMRMCVKGRLSSRPIDLWLALAGIMRTQMSNPPVTMEVDTSPDSQVNKWRVRYLLTSEQQRRLAARVIEVELVFQIANCSEPPMVRVIAPRLKGRNIFSGAVCLYELSSTSWVGLQGLPTFLVTLREVLCGCDLEDHGNPAAEYDQSESLEGFAHIAESHPEWGLGEVMGSVLQSRRLTEAALKKFHEGDLESALLLVQRGVRIHPTAAGYHLEGVVHHMSHNYSEALASIDHALELRPNYPPALWDRSTTLFILKRYAECASELAELLTHGPNEKASELLERTLKLLDS